MGRVQIRALTERRGHLTKKLAMVLVAAAFIVLVLIAVVSFVFNVYGCFGGCGRTPHIEGATCYTGSRSCMLEVAGGSNPGADADIVSCAFTVGNEAVNGTVARAADGPQTAVSVPSGQVVTLYCSGYPEVPQPGGEVQGQLQAGDGWLLPFSATWA